MRDKFIAALQDRTGKEVFTKAMEKGFGISVVGESGIPIPVFYWEIIEPIIKEKGIDHVVDMYIDCMEKVKEEVTIPEITKDYIKENVHSAVRKVTDDGDILKDIICGYEVYYVLVIRHDESGRQIIKLTHKMIESYGLTIDDVRKWANENDYKQLNVMSMNDLYDNDLYDNDLYDVGEIPMYIVTTEAQVHGGGVIFSKKVIEKIREMIGDFIILPSSKHETIVISNKYASYKLIEIVKEVNETIAADDDILGDTVLKCIDGKIEVFDSLTPVQAQGVEQSKVV